MSTTDKGWVFYDDGDEAIEDGVAGQVMRHVVVDEGKDARALFWIRGDAERYVRDRNRERTKGFTLSIGLGNAAMSNREDVVAALRQVAQYMEDGESDGNVFDLNGNVVGRWGLALPEPPTEQVSAINVQAGQRIRIGDDFERVEEDAAIMPGDRVEIITEPYSEGVLWESDKQVEVLIEEEGR